MGREADGTRNFTRGALDAGTNKNMDMVEKQGLREQARAQIRAQVNSPRLYLVLNVLFALLFTIALLLALFANNGPASGLGWPGLLLCAAGGTMVYWLLAFLMSKLPRLYGAVESACVGVLMAAFFLLQVVVGLNQLSSGQPELSGTLQQAAAGYALEGARPANAALMYSGDGGALWFLGGFYSLLSKFGVTDFAKPTFVLSLLLIDGAVLLLYFCVRRIFGAQRAVFSLLAAFGTLPLLLYGPLLCADIMALPFPVAIVLLWLYARSSWRSGRVRDSIVQFCLLSILAGVGALFRTTVFVVWAAVAFDMLFLLCGKGRLRLLLAGAVAAALLFFGGGWLVRRAPMMPVYGDAVALPANTWVMAGLEGNGELNAKDIELALQGGATKSQRAKRNSEEISARLGSMGFGGTALYELNKLCYTFSDGGCGAFSTMEDATYGTGPLSRISFATFAGMLVWVTVGAFVAIFKRNDSLTFVRVALLGLVIVMLVGTTSPRSLIAFLPLFLLCAVEALPASHTHLGTAEEEEDWFYDEEEFVLPPEQQAGPGSGPADVGAVQQDPANTLEMQLQAMEPTDYIAQFMAQDEQNSQE